MTVPKEEDLDGELCSVFSSTPEESDLSAYSSYHIPYAAEHYPRYATELMPTRAEDLGHGFLFGSTQT